MVTKTGIFLRKLRLDKGEIMKTMADKLSVSSSFLSAVENGKKKMPIEWREKIIDLYQFDEDQKKEWNRVVIDTVTTLEMNLTNLSAKQKEVVFSFARKLEDVDDDVLIEMSKLLEGAYVDE